MKLHNGSTYDTRHYQFARVSPLHQRNLRFTEPKIGGKISQLVLALGLVALAWSLAVVDLLWGIFERVPKP